VKGAIRLPLYVTTGDGSLVRLATRCCTVCGDEVTQHGITTGRVAVARIGGDSANGYAPTHLRCCGIVPQTDRLTPTADDNDD